MPRRKLVVRPQKILISLPGDLAEKLRAFLMSDRRGEVPYGGMQKFIVERIEEYFARLETQGNDLLKEIENGSDEPGSDEQAESVSPEGGAGDLDHRG